MRRASSRVRARAHAFWGLKALSSSSFLADLQEDWIANGKAIFPVLREKHPQAYFSGLVALSKLIRWETEEEADAASGIMTPEQIMDKLEARVGPKGRKLFEQFLTQGEQAAGAAILGGAGRTLTRTGAGLARQPL